MLSPTPSLRELSPVRNPRPANPTVAAPPTSSLQDRADIGASPGASPGHGLGMAAVLGLCLMASRVSCTPR